jgi:acyl dehydratase
MPITAGMLDRTGAVATDDVEDRWLMNYAASVGDATATYFDNRDGRTLPGHPAYVSHLEWDAISNLHEGLGELTDEERLRGVHSFNHTQLARPIRSGDKLTALASVVGIEQRRSGARLTIKTQTTDTSEKIVATSFTSSIFRGVEVAGEQQTPDMPRTTMPEKAPRGRTSRTITIGKLAPYVFSECARDYGAIHTDIAAATRAGLPGLILHGTATIAYALSDIVNHELESDPTAVAGFQANLRAMLTCPSQARIEVTEDPAHDTIWFDLLTEDNDKAISAGAVITRSRL